MIHVLREWITALPSQEQEKDFFSSLSNRYTPLLKSGIERIASLLNIPSHLRPFQPGAELFASTDGKEEKFFYYLKSSSGLEVGSIAATDISSEHHAFVQSILSAVGGDAKRRRVQSANRAFASLCEEWGSFSISEEDRNAAHILFNPAARSFLRKALKEGRIEFAEEENAPNRAIIRELERTGMLKSQFSVFCRQTGNQIMMVDSMGAIQEATKQGFKCFACSRAFSEENLKQFVSPTNYGQKMSRSNYWLAIQTCETLMESFASDKMCVAWDQDVAAVFLDVETSLILIEIKETPYLLKDAYLFTQKIELFKPVSSLILLLSPPSEEVSRYLYGSLENHPFLIQGSIEALKEKLPDLLKHAYKDHLMEILQKFTGFSAIPLEDCALSYFFPKDERMISTRKPAAKEDFEPPPGVEVEAPQLSLGVLPSEILEFETRSVVRISPDKHAIIQKIVTELSEGVAAGRESSLHLLLQDLSDADRRCQACLISQDGLVVASTLKEDTSEVLASYGSEGFTVASKILRGHNIASLNTLTMASKNFSVEFYPVADFYLAIATLMETVVTDPIRGNSVPEGLQLVCERLLGKKFIQSVAVLNEEGLLLCEAGEGSQPFPVLLEIFSKLAPRFASFGMGKLESIVVRSPSNGTALFMPASAYYDASESNRRLRTVRERASNTVPKVLYDQAGDTSAADKQGASEQTTHAESVCIGIGFDVTDTVEDFIPLVLAVSSEAAKLFSPAEVL